MTLKLTYERFDRLAKKGTIYKFYERCGIKGSFMSEDDEENEMVIVRSIKGIAMPTETNMNCEILLEDK